MNDFNPGDGWREETDLDRFWATHAGVPDGALTIWEDDRTARLWLPDKLVPPRSTGGNVNDFVKGPSDVPKTVMVMVDPTEAAIVRDALNSYGRAHIGKVSEICHDLHDAFLGVLAG